MADARKLQVAAADGTSLSAVVAGEGPALVFLNGIANTELQWVPVLQRVQGRARLLTWDYRGHGHSDRAVDPASVSLDSTLDDLRRVMDAAGIERGVLLGYSMGAQLCFEAWRRYPQRITGIISVLGCAGRAFDHMGGRHFGRMAWHNLRLAGDGSVGISFRFGARFARPLHRLGRTTRILEQDVRYADFRPWWQHLRQIHPPSFRRLALDLAQHDAHDLLPRITVPTQVISGGADIFAPPPTGHDIAARLPGVQHLHLPHATHLALMSPSGEVPDAIVAFLAQQGLLAGR